MTTIVRSNNTIPSQEVRFVSSASPVHQARVFRWQGEIYRAVRPSMEDKLAHLRRGGLLQQLIDQRLVIPTEATDLRLDGYSTILKHKRIPFVTFPFEWTASALRDAALLQIDVNLHLATHYMMCVDAHPWNVLFDGVQPNFIDIGSFGPLTAAAMESSLREFYGYYVYPLRLMRAGQWRLARALLRDRLHPISHEEFAFLGGLEGVVGLSHPRSQSVLRYARRVRSGALRAGRRTWSAIHPASEERTRNAWIKKLESLRRALAEIAITPPASAWTQYYGGARPDLGTPADWSGKQHAVDSILARLRPGTVTDIGSNAGWYSQLAATRGCKTVASEVDEACLELLYSESKERDLYIVPVYLNIRDPSPRYGWTATPHREASERLKADCVFAFALIHHLVFHQMADFTQIVEQLSGFTRESLVLEFVSSTDAYVSGWWHEGYSWYTIDNLKEHLYRFFEVIDVVPSSPEGRWLLVCTKKRAGA